MSDIPMESTNHSACPRSETLGKEFRKHLRFSHFILSVSHSDYRTNLGGTEKFIRAEKSLFEKLNISYIHIFPSFISSIPSEDIHRVGISIDGNLIGTFTFSEINFVFEILTSEGFFKPVACHIHHLKFLPVQEVSDLIRILNPSKIRFFIHDYYAICSQLCLIGDDGLFCGAPPIESEICANCSYGVNRKLHIKSFSDLFRKNNIEFIAPSEVAADLWNASGLYENTCVRVIPHFRVSESQPPTVHSSGNPQRIRIAYIGYQADHKGWQTWSKIVEELKNEFYEFYQIGAAVDQLPGVLAISLPLEKDNENLVIELIRNLEIDVALLWSIWPETYSFSLFESLAGRCFIITNPQSGNIAKVVRDRSAGAILAIESDVLDFFKNYTNVRNVITKYRICCPNIDLHWNPTIPEETAPSIYNTIDIKHKEFPFLEECELSLFAKDGLCLESLPIIASTPQFNVELINGNTPNAENIITIKKTAEPVLVIAGWAFDSDNKVPASAVFIKIDGIYFMTIYGLARTDVAEYFNNDQLKNTGFIFYLSSNRLSSGTHSVTLVIISHDKNGIFRPEKHYVIEIID